MNTISRKKTFLHKIFQNQGVRFFLSSGIATLVDIILYFILFSYILDKKGTTIMNFKLTVHEFSLVISYSVGIIINFLLTKYAVFKESNLASRKQFFRFALIAGIGFFANYGLLRLFVEILNLLPTLSRVLSALSLGIASFYIHRLFTFKIKS